MTVYKWSQTAASDATADSTINWAEGQAPSSVNDSARAMMAAVAKWRDDNAGALTTGGTATAFTLTTNQVFSSLSAMSGMCLRVKFNATNGASPTLNVDGLGAKSIVSVSGTAVGTGSIRANQIYDLVYANGSSEWILIGGAPTLEAFPSGTLMLFQQTSAPTAWTKQTTHNDKALRVVSGIASSGGSTAFTTVFAARTIAQANLPSGALTGSSATFTATAGQHVGSGTGATTLSGSGTTIPTGDNGVGTGAISSLNLGGSGTAMDFAVQYVDLIIASKD